MIEEVGLNEEIVEVEEMVATKEATIKTLLVYVQGEFDVDGH